MLDCKAMNTPTVTNLNFLNDDSLEIVDVTLYRQIIGSLMYLMNTQTVLCFVVNIMN